MSFKWGTWWAICDRCGFTYKNTQLFDERHTGLKVCSPCLDIRNPQDYARIPRTESSIPWSRPEPADLLTDEAAEAVDCTNLTVIPIPSVISVSRSILKGISISPVTILDGVTVTVYCEWEIR